MTAGRLRGAAIGAVVAAVMITGCSGGGSKPTAHDTSPSTSTTPTSSPSPSLSAAQLVVVRAYNSFWKQLTPASRAKSATRQLMLLNPMTTDPELSQLIAGFSKLHKKGQALYGVDVPRPTEVTLTDGRAEIRDCQDSHAAGVVRVSTGERLTVGVRRHLITATLLLHGSQWKVSRVDYAPAGTPC